MTHKQLVEIAYKWLLKNGGVGVAFKELKSTADEIPDVIGFDCWQSIVIEVKVSRSDYLADMKKPHRAKGMGNWRFYCCPKGLIKVEELPEKWGLIYVDEKGRARIEYDCRVKIVSKKCEGEWEWNKYPSGSYNIRQRSRENRFEADMREEQRIMYSALRRLFVKGYMKHIYDKQYKLMSAKEIIELNQ